MSEKLSAKEIVARNKAHNEERNARPLPSPGDTGEVVAVCISVKKGTSKENVGSCRFIEEYGLEHDAHAGHWHRQVSLLSHEEVEYFRSRGANVADGAFGENLLVKNFDFRRLPVGTIFSCNDVTLEMTQIGKKCHSECAIFHQVGDCIMPREGVFARVLTGGTIKVGDQLTLVKLGDGSSEAYYAETNEEA